MRERLVRIIVAGGILVGAVPAVAQEPPIDLAEARRAFDAARAAGQADGGRLWGVELHGPVFLVDRATRFVVADRADAGGALEETDGLWTGTLPENLNPANSAIEWAGQRWTMVLWPTPSIPHARNWLLLHEMFHRIQDDVGLPAGSPANAHLDTMDGRIWLRLEMRALARALTLEGDARRAAVGDALAFRERRRGPLPDTAAEEEDALERNEGMAEYTGLVLGGLPEAVLADRAAVALEERESSATPSRAFAYATGPAYGLLLDAADPGWRRKLVDGASLSALLAEAYDPSATARPVEGRIEPYGGARLMALETARESARQARLAELRARFLEGPTLRMTPGSEFGYSFDPNAAFSLGDAGTVYDPVRVTDAWGILEAGEGGALLTRNAEGRITGVVVPVAADAAEPPTAGEGWTLQLADGWEIAPGERSGDWVVRPAAAGP
ncbi:MAG TPA: hypothetical protein VM778_13785 [Gemmatimonadota bacterium]|nr:hypothetical protein [Gemmatimonadota bacterium]